MTYEIIFSPSTFTSYEWICVRSSKGSYQTDAKTVAIGTVDTPRFQDIGDGHGAGLLIEKKGTNLLSSVDNPDFWASYAHFSEFFSDFDYDPTGRLPVTASVSTVAAGNVCWQAGFPGGFYPIGNSAHCWSMWARQAGGATMHDHTLWLRNGTLGDLASRIIPAGFTTWGRYYVNTIRYNGSDPTPYLKFQSIAANGAPGGATVGDTLIHGLFQLEKGPYPTSPIFGGALGTSPVRDPDYIEITKDNLLTFGFGWLCNTNAILARFECYSEWSTADLIASVNGDFAGGFKRILCTWDAPWHLALVVTATSAKFVLFNGTVQVLSSNAVVINRRSWFSVEIKTTATKTTLTIFNAASGNGAKSVNGTTIVCGNWFSLGAGTAPNADTENFDGVVRRISNGA